MTAEPNCAMLFAAGLGTRMAPLSKDRPKPLVPVAGKTLLDHALQVVSAADVETTLVNTHFKSEMICDHLKDENVLTRFEPELLDTGGGLKAALPQLGNPVFTLNTDAVWVGANPLKILRQSDAPPNGALLLLVPSDDGDFSMDQSGRLTRGGPWKYTGAQIICTDFVASHPKSKFSLNEIWDQMMAVGLLKGVPYPGKWCEVGTPDAIKSAERMLGYA